VAPRERGGHDHGLEQTQPIKILSSTEHFGLQKFDRNSLNRAIIRQR
jgi:hypothetical protein